MAHVLRGQDSHARLPWTGGWETGTAPSGGGIRRVTLRPSPDCPRHHGRDGGECREGGGGEARGAKPALAAADAGVRDRDGFPAAEAGAGMTAEAGARERFAPAAAACEADTTIESTFAEYASYWYTHVYIMCYCCFLRVCIWICI